MLAQRRANVMEWPDASSYRDWDDQADCAWFRWKHPPTKSLMAEVRPLKIEYASQLWRWIFPTNEDILWLVAEKNKKSWLKKVFESEPVWFGRPMYPPLQEHLRRLFSWPDSETVFFLVRCGKCYQTPWRVYVEHPEDFLGCNDDGLLFHPTAREVAVFWEVSAMFVGRRSKRFLSKP